MVKLMIYEHSDSKCLEMNGLYCDKKGIYIFNHKQRILLLIKNTFTITTDFYFLKTRVALISKVYKDFLILI